MTKIEAYRRGAALEPPEPLDDLPRSIAEAKLYLVHDPDLPIVVRENLTDWVRSATLLLAELQSKQKVSWRRGT